MYESQLEVIALNLISFSSVRGDRTVCVAAGDSFQVFIFLRQPWLHSGYRVAATLALGVDTITLVITRALTADTRTRAELLHS